jgi:CRISPR-associated endonuclease Cas1
MHTQPTSAHAWPDEAKASGGIVVAGGYGLRINVWRGRLRVDDGSGQTRRSRIFHRATSGLKRLVVLGHTGYISLEALRWLADVKAAYLQIDADARLLATFGPPGTDRPGLRRAQAMAAHGNQALALSRWLDDAKLAAQRVTLEGASHLVAVADGCRAIEEMREALATSETIDELRVSEACAAAAYWQSLAPLEVRFARRDAGRVPGHWLALGGRSSPLANGPRMAANPGNAVLNYLYALLEAEATLASRVVGLDPGLGVMHADQAHRDSLAADLMEPIRPLVDAWFIELLTARRFTARDFFETSIGACRITPPLTHELAQASRLWGRLVGKVAEDLAAALEGRRTRNLVTPTPISGRKRAAGRPAGPKPTLPASPPRSRACSWCGSPTPPGRQTCNSECADRVLAQIHEQFAIKSSERMRRFAGRPDHPGLTPEANRKRSAKRKIQRAEELAWERAHPEPVDREWFLAEVAPNLLSVSARALARATGLSVSHCAKVKKGERVPHPMWWAKFASCG